MFNKEQEFWDVLQDVFVGAKVEGQGGFINLMQIKSNYYSQLRVQLSVDLVGAVQGQGKKFADEFFDKLHDFFSRYFSQNGSIHFNDTAFHNNVYERVYADDRDVALFWKTQMLYYVKTETLFRNMPVEFDERKFYFDASGIEHKKANEKKDLVFSLRKIEDETAHFDVQYSNNGKTTDINGIMQEIGSKLFIDEAQLQRAFRIFNRQSECDFFINKDAGTFLKQQFNLWAYQYFWDGAEEWDETRVNQLQLLKEAAFKVIDFIAQFEDELVRVWNKPKFVKNSNYVITLDRLSPELRTRVQKHPGYPEQCAEWEALGIDKQNAKAPIDTKFFKDLELDILAQFENLDESLDGWLIKSENYQALNTIKPKFARKVRTIYIDPPFNLESSDQFQYRTNYKDANWLTLLENRLAESADWLSDDGSILVRCNHDGNMLVRLLMDSVFGAANHRNEIIVRRAEGTKGDLMKQFDGVKAMTVNYDNVYWYSKVPDARFGRFLKQTTEEQAQSHWHSFWKAEDRKNMRYDLLGIDLSTHSNGQWMWNRDRAFQAVSNYEQFLQSSGETGESLDEYWARTGEKLEFIRREGAGISSVQYWIPPRSHVMSDNNWLDIRGYANKWGFKTENSEPLLKRVVESLSEDRDLVLDYFAGSGTTLAAAHKMNRRWVGVEMGEHFYSVILPRMKAVLAYDPSGISKEVEGYEGGGFFKYYELEQYEETLENCKYADGDLLNRPGESVYEQYVFLSDEKMLAALEIDEADQSFRVDLGKLYDNIDLAETLSNLEGKWIKSISKDRVEFADGKQADLQQPDHMLIKPLIWWERKTS